MPPRDDEPLTVWIGWDAREEVAAEVAKASLLRHASIDVRPRRLVLSDLRARGLYRRDVVRTEAGLFDPISDAPMATEFAISRFFLPWAGAPSADKPNRKGWALFVDCDVLFRHDVAELAELADPTKAVMVVKHDQVVASGATKMDGQPQTAYPRKNWSSVVLWNLGHPGHERLTLGFVNERPGRDLHAFCWLADDEIGDLPPAWNWLEGYSRPIADPALVHYTRGGPWIDGWENVARAGDWLAEAGRVLVSLYRKAGQA